MLSTAEAAALLEERDGIPTPAGTVLQWCKRGKFPNAIKPKTRRGEWRIPQEDIDTFIRPTYRRAAHRAAEGES